ncbi:MAG: hypothetical protein PHU73_04360 [Patescibacteria group bacterium]|nr:hypothetical protein [Patescibacteria group bacterium]
MIFEHQSKNKKVLLITSLAILVLSIFVIFYSSVIFQEGNPWPQIKGIAQLTFGNKDIVKLDTGENKYITKSNNSEIIKSIMKEKGYDFTEQMGSGYFYKSSDKTVVLTRRQYSRFYTIWTINKPDNTDNSIAWLDYKNDDYNFIFSYPALSVDNQLWGNLSETLPLSEILLPNQILSKGNNFYLHQKYSLTRDRQSGLVSKTENTFIPEYDGSYNYPLAWHIVIFDAKNEVELERIIKKKLGPGCSYKDKISTEFKDNYRVEINGDGKDLGSTLCPVNYYNYIVYSPTQKKVAFWSTGQECQIGLGFEYNNCFDEKISNSFHFTGLDAINTDNQKSLADQLKECLPKSDTASHEKCNELLATIRNFDDCVNAGFSIMKSSPSQCAIPDGRNFTDETNSNWNVVLTTLNNCEVESVFQTHSKLVTLKLKNGNKLTAYEPQIDDVMKAVESLSGECGDIRLATE